MCTQGVNLTQFKLSIHQLEEGVKLHQKSANQWKELLSHLNLSELSEELKECENLLGRAREKLEGVLKKASELEHQEDDVEVTPI